MAGAKYVILATVDGFEDRSETLKHTAIGRESTNREIFASAVVQIVDTTSGRMMPEVPSVQMVKGENVELAQPGGAKVSDRVLAALAKDMAQALARQATAYIRPAKVLAVTGKQILINQGANAGFSPGTMVEILATQEIIDEDTGESFLNEVPVGTGKVSRSDARKSFAILEGEDLGIAKGCIARPLPSQGTGQAHRGQGNWADGERSTSTPTDQGPAQRDVPRGSSDKPW